MWLESVALTVSHFHVTRKQHGQHIEVYKSHNNYNLPIVISIERDDNTSNKEGGVGRGQRGVEEEEAKEGVGGVCMATRIKRNNLPMPLWL